MGFPYFPSDSILFPDVAEQMEGPCLWDCKSTICNQLESYRVKYVVEWSEFARNWWLSIFKRDSLFVFIHLFIFSNPFIQVRVSVDPEHSMETLVAWQEHTLPHTHSRTHLHQEAI